VELGEARREIGDVIGAAGAAEVTKKRDEARGSAQVRREWRADTGAIEDDRVRDIGRQRRVDSHRRASLARDTIADSMNRLDVFAVLGAGAIALATHVELRAEVGPTPPAGSAASKPMRVASAPASAAPRACAPLAPVLPELISVKELDHAPVPPIEDGDRLAPFYERLARTLRGTAVDHVRIGVYGDSNGCQDFLTGEMRRWLQTRWGDAGHGYLALGKPWNWYIHRDVRHGMDRELWTSYVVSSRPAPDAYYGHGLIAAESSLRGATTWFATADDDAIVGRTVSRVEIWYLKSPRGGAFDVVIDGAKEETIDTRASAVSAAFRTIELADAPHKVTIVPRGGAPVRLLGATLERGGSPSFVVDALSVGAANWRTMLREDMALDRTTLEHRGYGILVLHMGTNTWTNEPKRAESMRAVLARLREEVPDVPLLVMSSPDHATNAELIASILTPEQRSIAHDLGAAFFDFHAAMGGIGSMQAFFRNKMAMNDVVHFNEAGGAFMGRRVLYALWRDFSRWLATHPDAGC
jgi:hypothetical protein